MAQWTDPSRTFLIQEIRNKPIIWDKDVTNDSNLKAAKLQAFAEVTEIINETFPGNVKFTCYEVRQQWKNLKDTFVRKLRYINEGKYAYDTSKEITWKFYKMLSFLDDSKKKTVENQSADHPIFDIAALQREHGLDLVKSEVQFENSNHSASSSEELMQSLFAQSYSIKEKEKTPNPPDTPPSPATQLPRVTQSSPESYSPSASKNHVASSGDEDEPRRKKMCRRIVNPSTEKSQDEFDIFGQLIAAQLRRTATEHSHSESLRLQKKLNDALFEGQIALLEQS